MNAGMRIKEPFLRKRGRLVSIAVFLAVTLPVIALKANAAQTEQRSGKDVVEKICATCHATGVNGAPKIGDKKAWSKRASQGLTSLTQNALQGIRRMPAHGGHPELTDLQIERAITYMVNQSGGHWVEPVSAKQLTAERSGEEVVKAQCVKCHGAGVGGAPKIGDQNAWIPRIKNGIDYLVASAIHGHGGMPSRGGLATLTDNEIRGAIIYMFSPAAAAHAPTPAKPEKAVDVGPGHMTAGGMDIYLGVAPAESILSYPKESAERTMHGGVPRGPDYYHVNVSLWDHATGAPVDDAKVAVEIDTLGTPAASELKSLEPTMALGAGSYGNYVIMKRHAGYAITVQVQTPRTSAVTRARFEYKLD
jgi:cytochrome c5